MSDPSGDGGFSWNKQAVAGLIVFALLVGGGIVIFDRWIMPPRTPKFDHPSTFDVLIDSRLIVGLIRLIAIILALYVIISVFAHIRGRRWIIAFGGAQTGAADRSELQKQLAEAEANYQTLTGEYESLVTLVSQLLESIPSDPGGGDDDPGSSPGVD